MMAAIQMQRRLTTILAADVVEYSRLTGVDEEGTLQRMEDLRREVTRPSIERNCGRIFHTAGDSFLAEFTLVVDALRCAVEVQREMRVRNADFGPETQIRLRMGIHLGDVVVVEDGDLLGNGVNIAARLEGRAGPGGICLSHAAYEQVRDKVPEIGFRNLGDTALKNIPRPVRIYDVLFDRPGQAAEPPPLKIQPRLSIVVLPFTNIGGDFEQEYFVDGVSESLTTDLSRISGSFVIARNTAFIYKGKNVDVKEVGAALGVRYVLEGSVQRSGKRMRVNVQLIDAETAAHLWADRFDKPLADLFDMQDEIVARLANQLGTELVTAEARKARGAHNPDSMDLYFQGQARWSEGRSPEYLAQANEFFRRALELDPANVEALVGTAFLEFQLGTSFLTDHRDEYYRRAELTLNRALSMAPNHAMALCLLGGVHVSTNRAVQGIAECRRSIALDRNLAFAHAFIGRAKNFIGCAEETEACVLEALRLSPLDPNAALWMLSAGITKVHLGDDTEAVAWLRRAGDAHQHLPLAHFTLAAALAHLGRRDEALATTRAGLALEPSFTIGRFRAGAASDNPVYLRQRERILEGMRLANIPEGRSAAGMLRDYGGTVATPRLIVAARR
jgi:TolB-like protein/class 3 adenylate cyclase/Flp pilus assembly protein TadD